MKSNQQFARKCISNLPRFRDRRFRIVLVALRDLKVLDIKPSSEEQLTAFFKQIESFLIDYDLIATPIMGEAGDLFVNFATFQFKAGLYGKTPSSEFLTAAEATLSCSSVVDGIYMGLGPATPINDEEIGRQLRINMRELRKGGTMQLAIRAYIPGPKGFSDRHRYHTIGWSSFSLNRPGEVKVSDLIDTDLLVANPTPGREIMPFGGPNVIFALPVKDFLAYATRKGLAMTAVSLDGVFEIMRPDDK